MYITSELPKSFVSISTSKNPDSSLKGLAEKLEGNFLAEMLKAAEFGAPREAFGGGAGEEQFSSFLIQEYADAIAATGGIGLSETIYRALLAAKETAQ